MSWRSLVVTSPSQSSEGQLCRNLGGKLSRKFSVAAHPTINLPGFPSQGPSPLAWQFLLLLQPRREGALLPFAEGDEGELSRRDCFSLTLITQRKNTHRPKSPSEGSSVRSCMDRMVPLM